MKYSLDSLKRSLGMIAYMVARDAGVKLSLRNARTASTDGQNIVIPAIKVQSKDDWEKVEGYTYHEAAHVKYSDFSFIQQEFTDSLSRRLFNMIEDAWVEAKLEKELPGLIRLFRRLSMMLDLPEPTDQLKIMNGGKSIMSFLFLAIGILSRGREFLAKEYDEVRQKVIQAQGEDFVSIIEGMCKQASSCKSTWQARQLAQEIYDFLKKQVEKQPPQPQQQSTDQSDSQQDSSDSSDENSDSGNGSADSSVQDDPPSDGQDDKQSGQDDGSEQDDSGSLDDKSEGDEDSLDDPNSQSVSENDADDNAQDDPPSDSQDENQSSQGDDQTGNDGQDDGSEQDNSGSSDDKSEGDEDSSNESEDQTHSGSGSSDENQAKQDDEVMAGSNLSVGAASPHEDDGSSSLDWQQLLQEAADAKDRGEQLREWLMDQELEDADEIDRPQFPLVMKGEEIPVEPGQVSATARSLVSIREAVQADAFNGATSGYSGRRLIGRKLAGAASGYDTRVFTSPKLPQREMDTHVHILVDASGSMEVCDSSGSNPRSRMDEANNVVLGLRQCLQGVPGVNLEITAFTSATPYDFTPAVMPHSGRPNYGFSPTGNTPLGEALEWAVYTSAAAPERRKILFVVTDGDPDNYLLVKKGIAKLTKFGIQTIGIIIGDAGDTSLFDVSIRVKNAKELSSALSAIWVNLLYG